MSNGHFHQKTTENYIAVTSKNAPRSLSTRSARLQEVQATELLPEKNSGVWIDGRLCLSWFLKSGGRTWIDMEFRGGVKLRIINFAKTVTCTFWFLLFQPFPSKTRAYLFPSNIYPSRQRYFALERRMFMLMIALFGGFLRRPRSILTHLLSRSSEKK